MKYMLMMQFNAQVGIPSIDTWAAEEVEAHIAFMREAAKAMAEAGELVDAQGLGGPDQTKIVRARQGEEPVVSDGPFPETKEFLAGFWVVDVETPERAVELAAYVSAAPGPGGRPLNMPIEVHPIMAAPAMEA